RLMPLASRGLPDDVGGPGWLHEPLEVVLVVEGAARRIGEVPGVRVIPADGSGDDAIVELVRENTGRRCAVVTADRELRSRVRGLGAQVVGPRAVR
ncbi:MAG TPA: ADP-ribose pyrophosphatase, partial [Pseudonocardiaceae bacterium]